MLRSSIKALKRNNYKSQICAEYTHRSVFTQYAFNLIDFTNQVSIKSKCELR